MLREFENCSIESLDTNKMTKNDILKMYEIERDTWSYFMWEYVKCIRCDTVSSKEDIYWEVDINYNFKTICELEKEYWRENIKCNCCWWKTKDIRWEELISILELRIFQSKKWFVNFYKSKVDKVLGFSYWFIDSPEKTYEREFSYHFSEDLLNDFIKTFWNNDLLTLSWVCIKEESNNIKSIYELIKQFYCSVDYKNNNITWVWEVIINSPAYKIYQKIWAKPLGINEETFLDNTWKKWLITDIFYQNNIVQNYKHIIDMNLPQFIAYTKNLVKKQLEYN